MSLVFGACSNPDRTVEKTFAKAQEKLDQEQAAEAVDLLSPLHERWPDRLDVVEFLAFAHSRNNNPSSAADAFMLAAELAPERTDLILFAAQARAEAGDLGNAARHYRLYIADNFDDLSGWQALARLESERDMHRDAIDAYLQVYRIRPSGPTAAELGNLFLRLNNTAQAHYWFRTALDHSADSPQALVGLLRISLEEENWDRAQELVERIDREHPGELDAGELSVVREELRRWRESIAELTRIREEQAAEAARREALAREEEARVARELEEAVAARAAEAEEELEIEEMTGQDEAISDSDSAEEESLAELSPFEALVAKADSLAEDGRHGTAARTYWRALGHDDSSADVWFRLSRSHYNAGAWNDAELTVLEALRRDPEREAFHLHYLNVIKENQPVRTYLRELERIHEKFPYNHEVALALANTYARSQHSHQEAVRYYRLFLRIAPQDPRRAQVEESIRRLKL